MTMRDVADAAGVSKATVSLVLNGRADEIGIAIEVHHLPPGTSKWNKACPREGEDRAPSVLVHIAKLARQTAGQLSSYHRVDLRYHHLNRSRGAL